MKTVRILLGMCLIVLLVQTTAFAATRTWDGGNTADDYWQGDTAPSSGDALTFPGSARLTPNNDFAANADFSYYIKDALGGYTYTGVKYSLLNAAYAVTPSSVLDAANFGGGTINGFVTQFALSGGSSDVPEPSTLLLLLPLIGFGLRKLRRK